MNSIASWLKVVHPCRLRDTSHVGRCFITVGALCGCSHDALRLKI